MKTTKKQTFEGYYEAVVYEMELLLDICTSDAQGIAMLYEDAIGSAFATGIEAKHMASTINELSTITHK